MYPTILFVSPKRGGILQSSGFLDLKSLISLSQTCTAHAFDELSLIQLIENELTLFHKVSTIEEAVAFWRRLYRNRPLLRPWIEHGDNRRSSSSINSSSSSVHDDTTMIATRDMISEAACYEVMLARMLRTIPEEQRISVVSMLDRGERTVLHHVVYSGNLACIKLIIDLYRSAADTTTVGTSIGDAADCNDEQLQQVVNRKDRQNGITVLHYAASSSNPDSIRFILNLLPERMRLHAVGRRGRDRMTVLHYAASSGNHESVKAILTLLPEAQRLETLCAQDRSGMTVLHYVARAGHYDSVTSILHLLPEGQRLQAVSMEDGNGDTLLHCAARSTGNSVPDILRLLPEPQHTQAVSTRDRTGSTVLHDATRSGNIDTVRFILALYPESQRLRAVNMKDGNGRTLLQIASGVTRESIIELLPERKKMGNR